MYLGLVWKIVLMGSEDIYVVDLFIYIFGDLLSFWLN